jgi:hypothetical protein
MRRTFKSMTREEVKSQVLRYEVYGGRKTY